MSEVPVFEVAWEVANKVGGIYTVIRTKAGVSMQELGDRYYCVGLLNERQAATEVEDGPLRDPQINQAIENMRNQGCKIKTGRWLVDGFPQCILFDLGSQYHKLGEWKFDLFNSAKIELPPDDKESDDATVLGNLVCWFLDEYIRIKNAGPHFQAIVHFHEWLVGVGLILARVRQMPVATLFTTHATLLGRYLCAGDVDMYNNMDKFDVDGEAGKRGIYHRYCIERGAAHTAHIFTTVSQITAEEATHLLKRKPDVITPNGLNVKKFAALHEFQILHQQAKSKIEQFVRGHFHGMLDFNLDKTLYFFLAGRYEYRNKGADMYIESLARLNHWLQACGSDITVVAFIIMNAQTTSFAVDALEGQAIQRQLEATIAEVKDNVGKRIEEVVLKGHVPGKDDDLLSKGDSMALKRCVLAAQRTNLPSIVTHNLVDDANDPVLNAFRRCQLFNNSHDRVKVIFHPQFVSATSPIMPIDYDSFVRGCHMGVFPSYYEPWGYTPAECTVMGVPSITSNLAGFGGFIEEHVPNHEQSGLFVIDRKFVGGDESINQLTQVMFDFCMLDRRSRINLRNRVERLSDLLDWKSLGVYYTYARNLALTRAYNYPEPKYPEVQSKMVQNMPERRGSKQGVRLPGDLEHRNDQDQISIGELREMFKNLMASELRQ